MDILKTRFVLSPLMKAISAILASMIISDASFAAQCGANGGTVVTAETGNCTVSTASSSLNINSDYTGWIKFSGGDETLNIGETGNTLVNSTTGAVSYSAFNITSPVGTWTLNNKGNIKVDNYAYADIVGADGAGKYVINNTGNMISTSPSATWDANIWTSRGVAADATINNSGLMSSSGATFYAGGGNDHPITVNNDKSGTIKSTDYDLIYTTGYGASPVTLNNEGIISAGRYLIYQDTPTATSTLTVTNKGKITIGDASTNNHDVTFRTTAQGAVNINNTGTINAIKQNYLLWTSTPSNVTVNNGDNASITMDGIFADARYMGKANTLALTNGVNGSIKSTASQTTGDFLYTTGYLDLNNQGTIKSDKSSYLISAHGGAHIVNDTNGLLETDGSSAVIWQSAEGVDSKDAHYKADITNKGTIKSTGSAYGILSYLGAFALNNSGIISTINRAISIQSASADHSIVNTGKLISSDADSTINIDGKNTITNGGTISNGRANAYAIWTGNYDDALILLPDSSITGIVALNGGNNTLTLSGDKGTGSFDIGQVGASKQYRGLNNSTLYKDGADTWTLTGSNATDQTWKAVDVKAGMLKFGDNATFDNGGKAYSWTTEAGAITEMGASGHLKIKGDFALDGQLNVTTGQRPVTDAAVVTDTSTMGSDSTLNISGFSAPTNATDASKAYSRTLIITSADSFGGKTEPFAHVKVSGVDADSHPDYISAVEHKAAGTNYYLGTGLSWFAGNCSDAAAECFGVVSPDVATGSFTLAKAEDTFNADVVLSDQAANGSVWNGKTLTKNGLGTLTLSQANTYTGDTNILHGVLQAGIADMIKTSANVVLANDDATLDLNNFDQHLNNLSGSGNVVLGTATLTDNMSTDAEISGVISGSGNVELAGTSTLLLSNDNTYTGTTTVTGGTLQLGKGGTTGSVAGDITDNGTVIFNRSDDLVYGNVISGSGNVIKQNNNNMLLGKDQTYVGTTDIQGGSLILNHTNLASSAVTVGSSATLAGYGSVAGDVINNGTVAIADAAPAMNGFDNSATGDFTVNGNFTNSGTVVMQSPVPASTLTVKGNYIGNNGTLMIDSILGDDNSATDKLVVTGNTSGNTNVVVTNVSGAGAQTNNGIEVVSVGGQSDGTFTLKGRAVAGAYDYNLYKGAANGNWYLRTADVTPEPATAPVRPEMGSYFGNQSAAVEMFQHELHDRIGEYQQTSSDEGIVPAFWVRTSTKSTDSKSAGNVENNTDTTVVQLGNDFTQWSTNGMDRYHLGFMLGYGHSKTDSHNPDAYKADAANAKGTTDGYSVGAYGTWYQNAKENTGLYVDSSIQYTWYSNEVKGNDLASEDYNSNAWLISTEVGYALQLNNSSTQQWFIEPQAQLTYNSFDAEDHTESNGTYVHNSDADGLTTRLGSRVYSRLLRFNGLEPFAEVNWLHSTAPNSMEVSSDLGSMKLYDNTPKDRYEFKGGIQAQPIKDLRLFVSGGYQTGEADYSQWQGLVGARYTW